MRRFVVVIVAIFASLLYCQAAYAQTDTPTPTETETPTSTTTATATATQIPVPINQDLVACWDLEEHSGTRYDSAGSNHLTDNNTVGFSSGIIGSAADFISGNNEDLSIQDNAALSIGSSDFTISAWVFLTATGARSLVTKYTYSNREYQLWRASGSKFTFSVRYSDDSSDSSLQASNFGNPLLNTWYFVVAWFDNSNNQLGISVNNTTPNTQNFVGDARDSTEFFRIGSIASSYLQGRIDEVMVWRRVLTSDNIAWMYNSSSGRSCSDVVPAPTVTPTPTLTPTSTLTPTETPTPAGMVQVNLDSGDWMIVNREFTYGEIAVVLALGIVILVLVIGQVINVVEKWQ